jgi:hypothetical protein
MVEAACLQECLLEFARTPPNLAVLQPETDCRSLIGVHHPQFGWYYSSKEGSFGRLNQALRQLSYAFGVAHTSKHVLLQACELRHW